MNPAPEKGPGRLYQFDLIRLALVLLALASHFMSTQQWDTNLSSDSYTIIKMITRPAMPCLLIIFGFMIEHVYARRWKTKGSKVVLFKLTNRTLVCYLAFVVLTIVGAIAGYNAWWKAGANLFLLFPATHSNLFKYYTILIPIIFTLTWIRIKFGWKYKIAAVAIIVLFAELLGRAHLPIPGALSHMAGLLFGINDVWGPSIAHALILVLFGELAANVVAERKISLPFFALSAMIIGSFALVIERLVSMGPKAFMNGVIEYEQFRAHNSFVYFAYGIIMLILWFGISSVLLSFASAKVKQTISYYGSNTITLFFFGNMLILLTPYAYTDTVSSSVLLAFTLIAGLLSIRAIDWADTHITAIVRLNHAITLTSNRIATMIIDLVHPPVKSERRMAIQRFIRLRDRNSVQQD